jgi:hypothetical protein
VVDIYQTDDTPLNEEILSWLLVNIISLDIQKILVNTKNGESTYLTLDRTKYPVSESGSIQVRNAILAYIGSKQYKIGEFDETNKENMYRTSALRERETIEGYNDRNLQYRTSEYKVDPNWTSVIHAIMLHGLLQFRTYASRLIIDTSLVVHPEYKDILKTFGVKV